MPVKSSNNTARLLLKELPYFGINLIPIHGQFNNIIPSSLPTNKYLEKLTSLHDLDLFSLNTDSNINPDFNLPNLKIRSQYYSPHSFHVMKNNLNYYIHVMKNNLKYIIQLSIPSSLMVY